jgi:hypothetical protein
MGYNNYKKLRQVTKTFGLDAESVDLFDAIKPIELSDWLKVTLSKAKFVPLNNEKAKAERV